jgi:hypothetical protein
LKQGSAPPDRPARPLYFSGSLVISVNRFIP